MVVAIPVVVSDLQKCCLIKNTNVLIVLKINIQIYDMSTNPIGFSGWHALAPKNTFKPRVAL